MTFNEAMSIAKQIAESNKNIFKTIGEKQTFIYNAANTIYYSTIANKNKNDIDSSNCQNIEAYANTIKSFISSQNILNEDIKKVYIAYIDSITKTLIDSFQPK